MKRNITQIVNKNGIECYMDSLKPGVIVRGIINSEEELMISYKSINQIEGGFEYLDIIKLFNLINK